MAAALDADWGGLGLRDLVVPWRMGAARRAVFGSPRGLGGGDGTYRPSTEGAGPVSAGILHREGLCQVLSEVAFPARTWQLLAAAGYFGADLMTTEALRQIPVTLYEDLDGVVTAAQQTPLALAGRPKL